MIRFEKLMFVGVQRATVGGRNVGGLTKWEVVFGVTTESEYAWLIDEENMTHVWLYEEGLVFHKRADNIQEHFEDASVGFALSTILQCSDDSFANPLDQVG